MSKIQDRLQAQLADRYLFERELGKGGTATVYLARDRKHDRQVAIKVLNPDLAAAIGGDRFEREIKLAAKLQHPHILGLHDSGSADGLLFYVMPFVKGESLRDRLDRERQLPIDDAIQIALEVADALSYAHEQGIVHRDIKPGNVLLTSSHALVADFGMASAVSEGQAQKLTQSGVAVGTPVYMAPEQSSGETVGPTADLYSLGCMLYEMLAGEPPFTTKSAIPLVARHAMESVPSIRSVRPPVPEEVENAIFAAMAKVPSNRPQSAAHFSEMLGVPRGTAAVRRTGIGMPARRPVPSEAAVQPEDEAPAWWRRPYGMGAMVAALAAVSIGIWQFGPWKNSAGTTASGLDGHNVAVLYFEDLSKDKSLVFLADGLTEALISTLSQVQGLSVISTGGVQLFRGSALPTDSIARVFRTGTVVAGTIGPEGSDWLRVNVRIVDGNTGVDFQRTSLIEAAQDFLAVRDTVAQEVARLIRQRLGEEIHLRELRQNTRNVEAWVLVLRAEQFRKSGDAAMWRNDTVIMNRDFRAADSLLAAAEKADDKWADPIVARALISYRRSRFPGNDSLVAKDRIAEGMRHAGRALALDPGNPDALEVRGNLQYWSWLLGLEPDNKRSEELLQAARVDLERATEKNAMQAGAWASLSHLYYQIEEKSLEDVNLAARNALNADAFLSNASVIMNRLFLSSYDLGQFPDADHWCRELNRRFAASMDAAACELFLQTTKGRATPDVTRSWVFADSLTARASEAERPFRRRYADMLVAMVLARAGQEDSARAVIERSKGDPEIDPTRDLALLGAYAFAQLGDKAQSVNMLKIYLSVNERRRKSFAIDPGWQLRSLTEDAGFKRLVGGS